MKIEIASNREISARLKNAITEDMLYKDLAALINVNGNTIRRWEDDANSGGVREVAVIAAHLGMTPNQLLLKSQVSAFESMLTDKQLLEYIPLTTQLADLAKLCHGADESPLAILTKFIRSMNKQLRDLQRVPVGTVIKADGNVKTYDSPYAADVFGADVTGATGEGVAEETPPYGTPKLSPDPKDPDELRHAAAILRDEASKKDPRSAEFQALQRAAWTLKKLIDSQAGGSSQHSQKGPTAPKPKDDKPRAAPDERRKKSS